MMSFDWSSMPGVPLDRKSPARPLPGAALDDLAECRDIPRAGPVDDVLTRRRSRRGGTVRGPTPVVLEWKQGSLSMVNVA